MKNEIFGRAGEFWRGRLRWRDGFRTALSLAIVVTFLLFFSNPAAAQTPAVSPEKSSSTGSLPKSANVVNQPSTINDWEVGDIQVTFADGHTKLFTKGELCGHPHVSKKGDVGWSVWKDLTEDRYHHNAEILRVRLQDGTTKNFQPNNLFIMDWGFVDDDHAVIIKSMAHHGSSSFIKYEISTGKELGRQDDYLPYDQMPKWAQPYSDEKP